MRGVLCREGEWGRRREDSKKGEGDGEAGGEKGEEGESDLLNSAKVSAIMKIAAMTDRAAPDTDASVSSCCRSLFSFLRSHRRHAHESWSSSLPERDEESRKRPENPWWSGVRFPCSGLGSALNVLGRATAQGIYPHSCRAREMALQPGPTDPRMPPGHHLPLALSLQFEGGCRASCGALPRGRISEIIPNASPEG